MNRFDNLYTTLFENFIINEAESDQLPSPDELESLKTAANTQLPAIDPADNVDTQSDTEEKSALISQKKVQLIRLIALALSTRSPQSKFNDSPDNKLLHKLRVILQGNTTEGNVKEKEDTLIAAIAHLQNVDAKDIASQINYITRSPDETQSYNYISDIEYTQLVELCRKALLSNPESVGDLERYNITASDINSSNAQEKLADIKSIIGQIF